MTSRSPTPAFQNPLASPAPTRLPPALLCKVGETFAVRLSQAARLLARADDAALAAARAELEALGDLAVRTQEIARILGAEVPLPVERVSLARAVRETLDAWSPAAQVHDGFFHGDESCEIDVNAAVLEQLLDLAIDHALQGAIRVEMSTVQAGHRQAVLTIRVRRAPDAGAFDREGDIDDVRWALLVQLARATGLATQRVVDAGGVAITLTFPASEADAQADSAPAVPDGLPRTSDASGRRVLLIEPQEATRVAACDLMAAAGLRTDPAANLDQARDSARHTLPDVVVTGLAPDDDRLASLLDELRAAQPRLRVVQLVDDDNAFAFSAPGSDHPAQVGRHNLAATLVPAVAQELDAAWTN